MKKIIIFSLIFVFASSIGLAVGAQNGAGSPSASPSHSPNQSLNQSPSHSPNSSVSATPKMEQTQNEGEDSMIQSGQGTGQGEQVQNEQQTKNEGEDSELKNQESKGEINKEIHQSTVANFVQNLLDVADREGGIGEQVRTIAQEQNQSASTTIQAMEKVQTRSKVKTFFIGSDYKNLGELRSEMVQTENRLEQLNKLMESTQNAGDKTELQGQVQLLQQEQTKIESFINANESKFSLFGWLVKLFVK
jgi:hypothetical protein